MTGVARGFIFACWAAWAAYWLVSALHTKRTVERGGWLGYRLVALALVAAGIAVVRATGASGIWGVPPALALLSALLVAGGLAFTIWARVVLGRNWSAEVTFKQGHELIETGPYALVRHPIYTGLITMALGSVLAYGRPFGFVLLAGVCGALWWKAREEERIMSRHFPAAYADYRRRVRAIVPFVL
jgi:protein-S-isoprenylcysteine O-methyltransferase Ste14